MPEEFGSSGNNSRSAYKNAWSDASPRVDNFRRNDAGMNPDGSGWQGWRNQSYGNPNGNNYGNGSANNSWHNNAHQNNQGKYNNQKVTDNRRSNTAESFNRQPLQGSQSFSPQLNVAPPNNSASGNSNKGDRNVAPASRVIIQQRPRLASLPKAEGVKSPQETSIFRESLLNQPALQEYLLAGNPVPTFASLMANTTEEKEKSKRDPQPPSAEDLPAPGFFAMSQGPKKSPLRENFREKQYFEDNSRNVKLSDNGLSMSVNGVLEVSSPGDVECIAHGTYFSKWVLVSIILFLFIRHAFFC